MGRARARRQPERMWEVRLLLWIHSQSSSLLDGVFLWTHALGTSFFFVFFVMGVSLWHFRRREHNEFVAWLAVGVSTYIIRIGLKTYFAIPRPHLWVPLVTETGFSFPSGHALGAATFYPLFAWIVLGSLSARVSFWMALAITLTLLIGIGRLYLGVHWPVDVLAGWGIGFGQCLIVKRSLEATRKRGLES